MSMHMMKSTQDCGCGGASSGGGCGCGAGGDCGCGGGEVCTDLNFKRPRFFAGQLLTEDDLQALTDYVVGKNRLHNRFFWGDGVVCGLAVTCHPCEEGSVEVAPGYALDCCGNDIMVPCKEELDVKALLRDLRKRQLAGYDCGDPCDDDGDVQSYGLYLTYTETLEDPVAPYASGDPCGQQACEPTRVCEGYKFELRCDCSTTDGPDVWQRIRACIGDLRQAGAAVQKAQVAQVQADRVLKAVSLVQSDRAVPFDREGLDYLVAAPQSFAELAIAEEEGDGEVKDLKLPEERELRVEVAKLQQVTGAMTRLRLTPDFKPGNDVDLDKVTAEARAAAIKASERIAVLAPRVLTSPAARTETEETLRLAERFLAEDVSEERLATAEARMVALNTPVSFAQSARMQADASLLKDWLLDRLGNGVNRTRCDLYERLKRIRIGTPSDAASNDVAELGNMAAGVIELLRILLEYLIDCICLALNPLCQPCNDKGVLLACVKVKDCEVIDICNMSRRHVLTPVAMRYWLPPIKSIGKLIEKFCCEFDLGKLFQDRMTKANQPEFVSVEEFGFSSVEAQPIVSSMAPMISAAEIDADTALVLERFSLTPADVENVATFSSNLAVLTGRAAVDTDSVAVRGKAIGGLLRDRFPGLATELGARDVTFRSRLGGRGGKSGGDAGGGDSADLEARISDRLTRTVAERTEVLRSELGEQLDAEVGNVLDIRLEDEIPAMVTKELSAARIRSAVSSNKTVKTLKEENKRLSDEVAELSKAVAKLSSGGGS